jgi:hypothetical protein
MEYDNGVKKVLTNYINNEEIHIHYVDNKPHKRIQVAYLD